VSFGRLALANPDLSERIREGTVLNLPDEKTFYSGGSVGYLDYQPLPR
jgi:N-ethylmaleimide reductase